MKMKRLAECIVLLILSCILSSCGSTSTLDDDEFLELYSEYIQEEVNNNEELKSSEESDRFEALLDEANEGDVYTSSASVNETTIYVSADSKRQIVVDKINSNKQLKKESSDIEISSFYINDYDGGNSNSDKIANPGEYIKMDIGVHNKGLFDINGLKCVMTAPEEFITIQKYDNGEEANNKNYKTLRKNCYSYGNYHNYGSNPQFDKNYTPYRFTISKNVPYGTIIPLTFTFTDEIGCKWVSILELPVKKVDAKVEIIGKDINDREANSQFNNSDRIINPGETIYMDIGIKNTGNSDVIGLKGTLSCDSPYITIFEEHNSYDYGKLKRGCISGYYNHNYGEYRSDGTPYRFTVSKDAPYGTKIPLKFTFENSAGEVWTDEIITEVKKIDADVKIIGRDINDNDSKSKFNNSDRIINPGETIYMDIGIKNTGNSNIVGLKGTISCDSPYITIFEEHNSYDYGKLKRGCISGYYNHNYGEYRSSGTPYGFTVSKDIPNGTNISLKFTFENELGEVWTDEINSEVKSIDSGIEIVGSVITDEEDNSKFNSEDKLINPGETIFMDIGIKNTGKSNIVGLVGTLSCDSPYVTIFEKYNSYDYGKLKGGCISGYYNHNYGEYRSSGTPYGFEISKDTPLGTKIPLKFTFTGASGQTWECVKEIEVKGRDGNFNVCDLGFASEEKYFKPNSEISFDLKFKDTGKSFLPDLKVSLSSNSEYIDFISFEKKYENIKPYYRAFTSFNRNGDFYIKPWNLTEDEIKAYYPFKIKIAGNTPNGTQIPITATFTDSIGDKWEDKFYITVVSGSGEIKLINYELLDDTSLNFINNGDKKVNPGEQIFMDVGIHNIGNSSYNIVSTISSDSEYITIEDNKIGFNKIKPSCFSSSVSQNIFIKDSLEYFAGENNSYYEPFKFTVSKSAPIGSKIPIKINFKDSDMGKEWSDTIEIEVTK